MASMPSLADVPAEPNSVCVHVTSWVFAGAGLHCGAGVVPGCMASDSDSLAHLEMGILIFFNKFLFY